MLRLWCPSSRSKFEVERSLRWRLLFPTDSSWEIFVKGKLMLGLSSRGKGALIRSKLEKNLVYKKCAYMVAAETNNAFDRNIIVIYLDLHC